MMKLRLTIILTALLACLSCRKGERDGMVTAHFELSLQDFGAGSKAIADGASAIQLLVGVLDEDGNPLDGLKQRVDVPTAGSFSFDLRLVESMSYQLLLFAQSPGFYLDGSIYMSGETSSTALRAISLNASGTLNTELAEAFYASRTITADAASYSITLSRMCAQVNIASSQTIADVTAVSLTVEGVPSSFDVLTGSASGSRTLTFAATSPLSDQTFTEKGTDFNYIAYGYVPLGKDVRRCEATLTLTRGGSPEEKAVGSLPLQGNYRTNLLGEL